MKQRVVFEGDTAAEVLAKAQAYFQRSLRPTARPSMACARTVPAWAPAGSHWVDRYPRLIDAHGRDVPVRWLFGTPQRPVE